MLVISRKPGEKLRIGENVELVVLEISGSRVVIGIDAPREVAIRRVGSNGADSIEDVESLPTEATTDVSAGESIPSIAREPLPFEYPTRVVDEGRAKPIKAPVVTVRRSRKLVIPQDGEST
jgi:Global regulator protein family